MPLPLPCPAPLCVLRTCSKAMGPDSARQFYARVVDKVRAAYVPERVGDGVFGAMMDVSLVNDGPVTFIVDSGHQGAGHH